MPASAPERRIPTLRDGPRHVYTMEEALERMRGLIGFAGEWTDLTSLPARGVGDGPGPPPLRHRRDFAASLELAKAGQGAPAPVRDLRPRSRCAALEGDPMADTDGTPCADAPAQKEPVRGPALAEQERMVEAILFASAEPVTVADMNARMPHGADEAAVLPLLRNATRAAGWPWCGSARPGRCAPPRPRPS